MKAKGRRELLFTKLDNHGHFETLRVVVSVNDVQSAKTLYKSMGYDCLEATKPVVR